MEKERSASMDLQFLFKEPIIKVQELDPGYEDHASDVWLVTTDDGEVIVRSSRMVGEPDNDFWWGCKKLFGIDPRKVYELENINLLLNQVTSIPVPRVIHKGNAFSKVFVVLEKITGNVMSSFVNQPPSLLESLGEGLAKIHQYKLDYVGSPSGHFQVKLTDFHQHVSTTMVEIVKRFYSDEAAIKAKLSEITELLEHLPAPSCSSLVLVDMDPTQFLSDGKAITGLVDTEAYVIAPRELDFIGLEYVLDERSVEHFKNGYERIKEFPI